MLGRMLDGMSEAEDDHVGCKAEGCPNKCALGVDCGHVEDGFEGCGGAGHDVGVFHGCIGFSRSKQKWTIVKSFTYRIQSLTTYKIVQLFPAPGPWSSRAAMA